MLLTQVSNHTTADGMLVIPNAPIRFFTPDTFLRTLTLDQWLVQPKWDGHRALPVCDADGNITVFSRHKRRLTLAGNHFGWLSTLDLPRPWQLDGELMRDGRMIVWDYAILKGEYDLETPYEAKLERLGKLLRRRRVKGQHSIEVIESAPAKDYRRWLLKAGDPALEGFVLKHRQATNLWGPYVTSEVSSQFKYRFRG